MLLLAWNGFKERPSGDFFDKACSLLFIGVRIRFIEHLARGLIFIKFLVSGLIFITFLVRGLINRNGATCRQRLIFKTYSNGLLSVIAYRRQNGGVRSNALDLSVH